MFQVNKSYIRSCDCPIPAKRKSLTFRKLFQAEKWPSAYALMCEIWGNLPPTAFSEMQHHKMTISNFSLFSISHFNDLLKYIEGLMQNIAFQFSLDLLKVSLIYFELAWCLPGTTAFIFQCISRGVQLSGIVSFRSFSKTTAWNASFIRDYT